MTTAFVLSGGGSLGAVQAGMLQALTDNGVTPDLLIGTSAGALNAAYLAGHGTSREAVDALADIWVRLRRRDVFPFSPVRHALALAGVRESVFSSAGVVCDHGAPSIESSAAARRFRFKSGPSPLRLGGQRSSDWL
jgi:predicted acylesterase/phospholipase RssA